MKTPRLQSTGGCACASGPLTTLAFLVVAALPLAAAAPPTITGTGYLVGVPVPGILCTNAAGQVSLKGNVHVLMVQADDPRATGRFQASMDLAYQADGAALFSGAAYQEVGTWDVTDPANPKFTPTGGLWQCNYHGVAQPDGSDVITLTGYGVGGAIDGLRLEETITKGPGAPFDPPVPYLGSGTIKPASVTTIAVIDNFDDSSPPSWGQGAGRGTVNVIQANGQLTIRGQWPGIPTVTQGDTTAWASPDRAWTVKEGQRLEARVDLVSLSGTAPGAALTLYHSPGVGYWMVKGRDYVGVGKHNGGGGFTCLSADRLATRNTNEILVLALTPAGPNVILTARVLDKGNGGAVLYERSIMDTPASDPSLDSPQLAAITGVTVQVKDDPSGAPWTSGALVWLGVFQYTDGTLPPAEATFDNFELRTYEVPPIGIERAVQLTWPAPTGMNYAVEGGPTVQGPWLPVNDVATPGLKQMTVPANDIMKFFRLR
ncbi:MAG TPA: hypothetical protein P5186_21275 [Candidatus Paceibacterota bacterium]|nr:hypothetical protein [Candidatus Paceibacterota bacterium]